MKLDLNISFLLCSLILSFWLDKNVLNILQNNFQIVEECIDDVNWRDSKYGDGKLKCSDMKLDWCQDNGDYSIEALKSCPRSCGVCKGIHFYVFKPQL